MNFSKIIIYPTATKARIINGIISPFRYIKKISLSIIYPYFSITKSCLKSVSFKPINSKGLFNIPVGNVDFNSNVTTALENYIDFVTTHKVSFQSADFKSVLSNKEITKNDFVYLDPPYLITGSEYNKIWQLGSCGKH